MNILATKKILLSAKTVLVKVHLPKVIQRAMLYPVQAQATQQETESAEPQGCGDHGGSPIQEPRSEIHSK